MHASKVTFLNKITDEILDQYHLWLQQPKTFHLTFDDLINKNTLKLDQLQVFLFQRVQYNSADAILSALANPSPTKSSIRD